MNRLYSAMLIASVGMAQAAMIPQTSNKFKTFKEVSATVLGPSMRNGFMLGMLQQGIFFSVCHAVKGPYAFRVYCGAILPTAGAALKYAYNNITETTALERIDEESARMVHKHMYPFMHRGDATVLQESLRKFLPVYRAARNGEALSDKQRNVCEGFIMSNAYNDLLTQCAKRTFQGIGYVLSAACGPAAALMFLTGCTFGVLPCSMEGYELQSSSDNGINLRDFVWHE